MASIHLIVLIHGLYGSPANLAVVEEELLKASVAEPRNNKNEKVVVYTLKSFTGGHTWDGIDVNAWKGSKEIDREIERLEGGESGEGGEDGDRVDKFSIMGYSLGGLVARYLVGLLHSRSPSFFDRHRPVSFSTAATPHLGVLRYGSRTNRIVHTIGRRLFSRSGQQLYALDKEWEGRPILEILADPNYIFLQALQLFPIVQIVANGCHDLTVPYPTATFSLSDPFEAFENTGVKVEVDEHHVVKSWQLPESASSNISDAQKVASTDTQLLRRPRFPPILFLPYPFTYVLVFLLPIIIPLWLITASCLLTIHSIQSHRRHRTHHRHSLHRSSIEKQLLLSDPDLSADPASEPLLQSRSPTSNPRLDALRSSTSVSTTSSSATSTSSSRAGTETPPLVDMPVSLPDDVPPAPGQIPLLLTPAQKIMCRNLEAGLPQAEKIIAWFPWAFNAHALLVARDVKRFKKHEEGRGVIKVWARRVLSQSYSAEEL